MSRLIEVKLQLVPISSLPRGYVRVHPHKPCKRGRFPNLYFCGTEKGIEGNEVTVNGSVDMGDDGVVRWRFVSWLRTGESLCLFIYRKASTYNGHIRVSFWDDYFCKRWIEFWMNDSGGMGLGDLCEV